MRVDERQIDGPDLERAEAQQKTLLAEREEAELPRLAGEEVLDVEQPGTEPLLAAIQTIFEDRYLDVVELRLPQREERALEALQAAVHGRTPNLDQFVLAADRRSLLEQALAVLQPNLTHGSQQQIAAMSDELQHISRHVGALRESLMILEDGQDDLMSEAIDKRARLAAGGAAAGSPAPTPGKPGSPAKPARPARPADPDAPRPASALSGPGPEVTHERPPTTLVGPEVTQERRPTTLTGPDVDAPPRPETSLGDAAEIAAAAQVPWWRRTP